MALIGYGVSDPLGDRAWAFGGGIAAFKALVWLAGAVSEPFRWAAWGLALGLDLASHWLVARHTAAVPSHPEHLPERFGLFTIILLGEGMAAVVHALDHGEHLHLSSAVAALSFGLWPLYFHRVKGRGERHIADAVGGRRLRLWAYGHVQLYMGIACMAASTVALSAPGALTPLRARFT